MVIFRGEVERRRGLEYAPLIKTMCPHCTATVSFYTQLRYNRCTYCQREVPFPSRMAKEQKKRIEYHVHIGTEGEYSKQAHVHFMYLREGD